MPRTHPNLDLADALSRFLKMEKREANPNNIARMISETPTDYDMPKDFSMSRNTVENFANTGRGNKSTQNAIQAWLERHARDFAPEKKLPNVRLAIPQFFGTPTRKIAVHGHHLDGQFQAYALSTSRKGRYRRGTVSFSYDPKSNVLSAFEIQHRQADNVYPKPVTLRWNGYATVRGEKVFCVMRTDVSRGEATALFQIMFIEQRDPEDDTVTVLRSRSLCVNEDKNHLIDTPWAILIRKSGSSKIINDFIYKDEFDNSNHDDLYILEEYMMYLE